MTTYRPTIRQARRMTRRTWAVLTVLVLAALATIVVLLATSVTDDAPAGRPSVHTSQQPGGVVDQCRPSRVVHPC